MKKPPGSLLTGSVAAAILLAIFLHFNLARRTAEQRLANVASSEKIEAQRRTLDLLRHQVDDADKRYRSLLDHVAGEASGSGVDVPTNPAPLLQANARNARIGSSPELRQASVQAYVDDQKVAYGGLLKKLGLTPKQLDRFNAIQAEAQTRRLDFAVAVSEGRIAPNSPESAAFQTEAQKWEEDGLRDLFGPAYVQWTGQLQNLRSRRLVSEIVQHTFSYSGALSRAQADQLTVLLDSHKQTENGRTSYDWDGIFREATPILTPEQLDGFKSGVEHRLVSTQMNAIAASATKK